MTRTRGGGGEEDVFTEAIRTCPKAQNSKGWERPSVLTRRKPTKHTHTHTHPRAHAEQGTNFPRAPSCTERAALLASKCRENGMGARSLVKYALPWPLPRPLGRRHEGHKRCSGHYVDALEASSGATNPCEKQVQASLGYKFNFRASMTHLTQASSMKKGCARDPW